MQEDERSFSDGKKTGGAGVLLAGVLLVVFEAEGTVDVSLAGAGSIHGTNNSVLQVDGTNMDEVR